MTYAAFFSAVLALLLAPGPTNTLMGIAGARSGVSGMVRLLPAELFGYLTTILPLTWLGAELVGQSPAVSTGLKLVAAAWVLFLALKLWALPADVETHRGVTARRVYVTTMLNPKALIFGLVLLPAPGEADFTPKLGLFAVMVLAVAMLWGTAGSLTQAGSNGGTRMLVLQRVASLWLAFVSVTLIAGVLRA